MQLPWSPSLGCMKSLGWEMAAAMISQSLGFHTPIPPAKAGRSGQLQSPSPRSFIHPQVWETAAAAAASSGGFMPIHKAGGSWHPTKLGLGSHCTGNKAHGDLMCDCTIMPSATHVAWQEALLCALDSIAPLLACVEGPQDS